MKKYSLLLSLGVLGVLLVGVQAYALTKPVTFGNATQGNECNATSTLNYLATTASSSSILLKKGPGTFCSVNITKTDTGIMTFYDATTSDITQRASTLGTSTIQIANFPPTPTAGSYQFDSNFNYGLLVVIQQPGLGFGVASTTFTSR